MLRRQVIQEFLFLFAHGRFFRYRGPSILNQSLCLLDQVKNSKNQSYLIFQLQEGLQDVTFGRFLFLIRFFDAHSRRQTFIQVQFLNQPFIFHSSITV